MTSVLTAGGLWASMCLYVSRAPKRSSASNQPPTVITAGRMFFRCGRRLRAFQKSSYVAVAHDLVPEGHVALEVLGVGVGQRPHLQEELVAVGRLVVEGEASTS